MASSFKITVQIFYQFFINAMQVTSPCLQLSFFLFWGVENRVHYHTEVICTNTGWWRMMMNIEKLMECLAGETKVLEGKPAPVPLCLLRIPHDLTRTQTPAAAVWSRWLTTWVTARPYIHRNIIIIIISDEATIRTWGSVQVTRAPQPVRLTSHTQLGL